MQIKARKKTPMPAEIFLVVYDDYRTRTYIREAAAKGDATRWNNLCHPDPPARVLRSELHWEETDYQYDSEEWAEKKRKEQESREAWRFRIKEQDARRYLASIKKDFPELLDT